MSSKKEDPPQEICYDELTTLLLIHGESLPERFVEACRDKLIDHLRELFDVEDTTFEADDLQDWLEMLPDVIAVICRDEDQAAICHFFVALWQMPNYKPRVYVLWQKGLSKSSQLEAKSLMEAASSVALDIELKRLVHNRPLN